MNRSTGWDLGCHLVVKLKPTQIVLSTLEAIAAHGFKARVGKICESVNSRVAKSLTQSSLRRLLAGKKILSTRTLFEPRADGVSHMAAAIHGIAAESLRSLFDEAIAPALQGHMMLSFASAKDAERAMKQLQSDDLVEHVHVPQPRFFCVNDFEGQQWGHALLGATQSAAKVSIAVIDSGVDDTNPDLEDIVAPTNFLTGGVSAADADGHGTHCIGIIAAKGGNGIGVRGVCKPKEVLSMRVASPIDMHGYYKALAFAVSQKARVINLSLSGEHDLTEETLLKDAVSKGVVICAAVGNDGTNTARYPAALSAKLDGVIAVGAMTPERRRAPFSNTGPHVDLMAPGVNIMSTYPAHAQPGPPFCQLSGTSTATPFVTGAAAIAIQKFPNDSPMQIRDRLRAKATFLAGQTAKNDECGYGCVTLP